MLAAVPRGASAAGCAARWRRAPRAGRRRASSAGVVVAAGLDEAQEAPAVDRRGVDLERRQRRPRRRQLVVEREAAAAAGQPMRDRRRRHARAARRRASARQRRRRPAPGSRASRAARRSASPCMSSWNSARRWKYSASSSSRIARQRVDAGVELRVEPRAQLARATAAATRQRSSCAQARRVEQRVGPGDARRPRGLHAAVGVDAVRPAQDPELGEPGEVRELPGDRVDARPAAARAIARRRGRSTSAPASRARLSRSAAASAAPARRARRPRHARRARRRAIMIVADADASRPHRLARAGRRQQRQLAHRRALAALPRRWRDVGIARTGERRAGRRADRAARAPLGAAIARFARGAPGAAARAGADRHRPVPRHRRRRGRARIRCSVPASSCVLQPEALQRARRRERARKARVILQSAPRLLRRGRRPAHVDLVAVGHLRDEKDPLTLMRAGAPAAAPMPLRVAAHRRRARRRRSARRRARTHGRVPALPLARRPAARRRAALDRARARAGAHEPHGRRRQRRDRGGALAACRCWPAASTATSACWARLRGLLPGRRRRRAGRADAPLRRRRRTSPRALRGAVRGARAALRPARRSARRVRAPAGDLLGAGDKRR